MLLTVTVLILPHGPTPSFRYAPIVPRIHRILLSNLLVTHMAWYMTQPLPNLATSCKHLRSSSLVGDWYQPRISLSPPH